MANICTYNMCIFGKKDTVEEFINNGLRRVYDSFIIEEKEMDDYHFIEIEGECRSSVTNSMIRELDDGPTLRELSSMLSLEIEVFGYDKSEPEWIEHYHYNNGNVIREYALPPYIQEYMIDEYEVEIDINKYKYNEEHGIYIIKPEFEENFEWDEDEEIMNFTFTMKKGKEE